MTWNLREDLRKRLASARFVEKFYPKTNARATQFAKNMLKFIGKV